MIIWWTVNYWLYWSLHTRELAMNTVFRVHTWTGTEHSVQFGHVNWHWTQCSVCTRELALNRVFSVHTWTGTEQGVQCAHVNWHWAGCSVCTLELALNIVFSAHTCGLWLCTIKFILSWSSFAVIAEGCTSPVLQHDAAVLQCSRMQQSFIEAFPCAIAVQRSNSNNNYKHKLPNIALNEWMLVIHHQVNYSCA